VIRLDDVRGWTCNGSLHQGSPRPTKQSTIPPSVEVRIVPDALAGDDQRRFAEILLKPPPLAPAMKRALKARKRLIADAK
jgi:hypothetical protein